MKKNKKMRLIEEIIGIMTRDNREINHNNVSSWIMGQFGRDAYNWGKYGSLRQGDISLYFEHFYNHDSVAK